MMADETTRSQAEANTEQLALSLVQDAFDAARVGDSARLAQLLARGVPANVRTEKGDSLLMLATYHGHAGAGRLLLERGADPELANDRGQTPLAGVAFKGDVACVQLLLENGARADTPMADGKTPAMLAAMFDQVAVLELLSHWGVNLHRRGPAQATALDLARAMGATRSVAWLEARVRPDSSEAPLAPLPGG